MIAVLAGSGAGRRIFCQILYPLRGPTYNLQDFKHSLNPKLGRSVVKSKYGPLIE